MRSPIRLILFHLVRTGAVALTVACVATVPLRAATRTMTGLVADAMCGAHHRMDDAAACTRECVKGGSSYALVVNGAVYTLKADAAQARKLGKRANKPVVVRGDVEDMTVTVDSVTTPKKIRKH